MRLFIAIQFSPTLRESLLDAAGQLRSQCLEGRFTTPENLHLTLAFIGEVPSDKPARRALETLSFSPFPLSLEGSGHFRELWWVGLHRSRELDKLARDVRQALKQQGITIDEKPFRPHITLARQTRWETPIHLEIAPASMTVEAISLMESRRINGKLTYIERFRQPAQPQQEG